MSNIAVIIPIYKKEPDDSETQSISQCLRMLSKKQIIFCAPFGLDTSWYENFCKGLIAFQVERFKDHYFQSVNSYNNLLLSVHFYKRFRSYQYIFIYQPDAFVFRDELDYWCNLAYDNVGAPWFVGFDEPEEPHVFLGSGNGGCCLRKVASCIKVLTSFRYIEKPFDLLRKDRSVKNFIQNLTFKNNFYYQFNNYKFNEDYFFSDVVPGKFKWFKNCPPEKALEFSFEVAPSYLFKLNNDRLPMCCHGWKKYEYEFWKPFIEAAIKNNV